MPNNHPAPPAQPHTSAEEKIGYHKGCLNTLIAERNELIRIVQITEGLMQAHIHELEKMGIKLQPAQHNAQPHQPSQPTAKKR